jgi:hypothetical protein
MARIILELARLNIEYNFPFKIQLNYSKDYSRISLFKKFDQKLW